MTKIGYINIKNGPNTAKRCMAKKEPNNISKKFLNPVIIIAELSILKGM